MRTPLAHRHDSPDELTNGEPAAFVSGLIMNRQGHEARLRVTGQVSDIAHRHLDDWLDWLIETGVRQVTVALDGPDQIDTHLLRVLGVARARLQESDADIVVTAAGSPMGADIRVDGQCQRELTPALPDRGLAEGVSMIVGTVRTVATWPLRQLGLGSGHTIANATPTDERIRAARIEQFAYLTSRIAAEDGRVAVLTRSTGGDKPTNEVDVLVFRNGELIKLSLALDTDMLDAIYGTH
jgi:hypothetical protein